MTTGMLPSSAKNARLRSDASVQAAVPSFAPQPSSVTSVQRRSPAHPRHAPADPRSYTPKHLVEPKNFSEHWYPSFRALGIRPRGLYTTKDTCVTTAIKRGVKIGWLESQTGVGYATLKRHYGKWLRDESREDLRLFVGTDGDDICPRCL
jgi:hypothetical protein